MFLKRHLDTLSCYLMLLVVPVLFLLITQSTCLATDTQENIAPSFRISKNLNGRIEFWKLIFTKYGKNNAVLHHRQHPEIIYSVLDFGSLEKRYKGKALKREKRKRLKKETARIRQTLTYLGKGRKARNPFEAQIVESFAHITPPSAKKYRLAAQAKMIRSQTGIRERFRDGLVRSGRYLYAIEEIFRTNGLPVELARLPLVESSFDYTAYSSKGAAGIWQFMRSTGRLYLRINASIDERRDPILASRAAAQYLKHAYSKLGSWPLALTSYNHGIAGMMRARKKAGSSDLYDIIRRYRGRTFGFASSNFYPEFLAALEIEGNPQKYFPGIELEPPLRFDEIQIGKSITYSKLVSASGADDEKIHWLNRGLQNPIRKGRTPIPAGVFVKVPPGRGQQVIKSLRTGTLLSLGEASKTYVANLKKGPPRMPTQTYRVRRGDTIGAIARRFSVSQRELMAMNNIRNPRRLRAGKRIRVPARGSRSTARRRSRSKSYKVRSGDNLGRIAKRHQTSVKKLKALNPGLNNLIHPGQKITVP